MVGLYLHVEKLLGRVYTQEVKRSVVSLLSSSSIARFRKLCVFASVQHHNNVKTGDKFGFKVLGNGH